MSSSPSQLRTNTFLVISWIGHIAVLAKATASNAKMFAVIVVST